MKCEEHVDKGKTRIRGWHDFTPCKNTAKYKVTYPSGNVQLQKIDKTSSKAKESIKEKSFAGYFYDR